MVNGLKLTAGIVLVAGIPVSFFMIYFTPFYGFYSMYAMSSLYMTIPCGVGLIVIGILLIIDGGREDRDFI